MPIVIRPVVSEDIDSLARALAPLPLLSRYGRSASKLEADLSSALASGDGLLLAEDAGRPEDGLAGLAWFLRSGTFGLGAYLKLLAVRSDREGGGVGAVLLSAFEAEAARKGRHAFLLVSDFNTHAQAFYERHGWVKCGSFPGLVLSDVAELVYWKRVR